MGEIDKLIERHQYLSKVSVAFLYSTEIAPGSGEKMEGPKILPVPLYKSILPFLIKYWTP